MHKLVSFILSSRADSYHSLQIYSSVENNHKAALLNILEAKLLKYNLNAFFISAIIDSFFQIATYN